MKLKRLVKRLRHFDRIAVTGPQRSGSNIATVILADCLGLRAITEAFLGRYPEFYAEMVLCSENGVVVQCTSITYEAHLLPPNVAVVYMRRPRQDILASQKRIGWDAEETFKERYLERSELVPFFNVNDPISKVKDDVWASFQRKRIRHAFELDYKSLSTSPLWVPEHRRKDFLPLQIEETVAWAHTPAHPKTKSNFTAAGTNCSQGAARS